MPRVLTTAFENVATDSLYEHPQNPNRGNVAAIKSSIATTGFYGALIVQRSTRYILAGNHRWKAAVELGMATVPVIYVDVDDDRATRILLADNRSSELAHRDPTQLLALLEEVHQSADGLEGVGFSVADLEDLRALTVPPTIDEVQDRVGEYDPDDAWPTLSIKVSPEVKARFDMLWQTLDGADASAKLTALMDAAAAR